MELRLDRVDLSAARTIGKLHVDGTFECWTLEDAVRPDPDPSTPENEAKIPGATAIPEGRYRVRVTYSPRFKRRLPLLDNVPGFEGIRIHAGNTAQDTEGCILVGLARSENSIIASRVALTRLQTRIQTARECWITIGHVKSAAS